jgi:hypothetical protein
MFCMFSFLLFILATLLGAPFHLDHLLSAFNPEYVTEVVPQNAGALGRSLASGRMEGNKVKVGVACKMPGRHAFNIFVGNKQSELGLQPQSVVHVIHCAHPSGISLVHADVLTRSGCNRDSRELFLQTSSFHSFKVKFLDEAGTEFTNASSLNYKLKSSDEELAYYDDEIQKLVVNDHGLVGQFSLGVCWTGYRDCSEHSCHCVTETTLCDAHIVHVVHPVKFSVDRLQYYMHPMNQPELHVSGGSGCMSYQVSDPSVAAVDISEGKAMKALVAPLKPGSVVIEASDVCLLPQSHVNITLYFVDAAQIQLKGRTVITIHNTTIMSVRVTDTNNVVFDADQLHFMPLKPHYDSSALLVKQLAVEESVVKFLVEGLQTGSHKLQFKLKASSKELSSHAVHIDVINTFELLPSSIQLIEGGHFQLSLSHFYTFGDERVEVKVADDHVATVDKYGVIFALNKGVTIVHAAYMSYVDEDSWIVDHASIRRNPAGHVVTFSNVEVHVSDLQNIAIILPQTTLVAGTRAPVFIQGINGETPLIFGNSGLHFKWHSSDSSIITVGASETDVIAGKSFLGVTDFSAVIHAKSKGRGTISTISLNKMKNNKRLETSVLLNVIDPLVIYPFSESNNKNLLMTLKSKAHIKTNKDHEIGTICRFQVLLPGNAPIIEVDEATGYIYSSEYYGYSAVLVSCVEKGVELRETILVEVQPIKMLELVPVVGSGTSSLQPESWHLLYRNEYGRKFDAVSELLIYETAVDKNIAEVTIQAFDQKLQSPHVSVNLHTISAFQNMKPQDVVLKICSKFMESEITCSYASFQLQKEKAAFPTKELVSPTTSCANKTFAEDSSKKIKEFSQSLKKLEGDDSKNRGTLSQMIVLVAWIFIIVIIFHLYSTRMLSAEYK